jgi:hypothetical protein
MFDGMPPDVAKPVIGTARRTKKLIEDGKNAHAGFNYTTIDGFYEAVGPIMAEEGLFIFLDEREAKVETREAIDRAGRVTQANWLEVTFDIYLGAASGATFGPIRRTQGVRADSATAYGSAASYVEKYFLRQLFKIPTGETADEIDAQAPTPVPSSKKAASNKVSPELSASAKAVAIAAIDMAQTLEILQSWGVDNKEEMAKIQDADLAEVRKAFKKKHDELKSQQKEAA